MGGMIPNQKLFETRRSAIEWDVHFLDNRWEQQMPAVLGGCISLR